MDDMISLKTGFQVLGIFVFVILLLVVRRKNTWVSYYPPGYETFKVRTSRAMQEKKLDEYLARYKKNDLHGFDREVLLEILCLDHFNPIENISLPIELRSQLSLQHVRINSIPVKEIRFLFPKLTTITLDITWGAKPGDLLRLPALMSIFICGPHLMDFPHALSGLGNLRRLQLNRVNISKISFKNQEPFPVLDTLGITNTGSGEIESVEELQRGLPKLETVVVQRRHCGKWRRFLTQEYGERADHMMLVPDI